MTSQQNSTIFLVGECLVVVNKYINNDSGILYCSVGNFCDVYAVFVVGFLCKVFYAYRFNALIFNGLN